MTQRSDAVVFFGATGDLARKKLFPALYKLASRGHLGVPVIGVARSDWDDTTLRQRAADSVREVVKGVDEGVLSGLLECLTYVSGDYGDPATHAHLAEKLADAQTPVIYLAIPPDIFPAVIGGLQEAGLAARSRLVVEKPFGRDLASARELNALLSDAFDDSFDVALVMSGDSDLTTPIRRVRERFPNKRVIVAFPPRRHSAELKRVANGHLVIGEDKLRASQLPDTITKPDGFVLARPASWT